MLKLRIEDPAGSRVIDLPDEPTIVGRGKDAGIRIEEPRASREHLEIRPGPSGGGPAGVVVTDLGSTNGTTIGDCRVLRARLRPGEQLVVGDTSITLLDEKPAPPKPGVRPATVLAVVVPALVLLVLGEAAAAFVASSRDGEVRRARNRLDRIEYELARLPLKSPAVDPEVALASLTKWREEHADSDYVPEADREIAELRPKVARLREARARLEELARYRERGGLPPSELYYRYERLLGRSLEFPRVSAEIRRTLRELEAAHRAGLEKEVLETVTRARLMSEEGKYGRAASVLASFTGHNPSAASTFSAELASAEDEVMRRARAAYRNLITRADRVAEESDYETAAKLILADVPRFGGTGFQAFLRLHADGLVARAGEQSVRTREDERATARLRILLLSQEAESLAAAGLFARAAEKLRGVIEATTIPEMREEFAVRERELSSLAGLVGKLEERVAEKGEKFGRVTIDGSVYRVVGATRDFVRLTRRQEPIERRWSDLTAEEWLALFRAARFQGEDRLTLATWCVDRGFEDAFREEILALLEDDATREAAGELFARKQGKPCPPGGYVAYRGRILTREEHAEEVHREQVAKLRERQDELFARLASHATFKKLDKLKALRDDLDEARIHALKLIFDEEKYFYPYRDRYTEYNPVRIEVNARVDAVREIWNNPAKLTLKTEPSLQAILDEIDETNAELDRLGVDTAGFRRQVDALTIYLGRTMTVRDYFRDRRELETFEYNRKILGWNSTVKTVATDLERRQVEVTNEYRIMMGRHALAIDDRLVKSARGHSEEQEREGYFSHFSPHPERKFPHQRMALEGYKGLAASENIHRGSGTPEGAHEAWLNSSGHHRNLLNTAWTEMGTGFAGRTWTQNFGRTKPKEFPAEKSEDK